MGSKTITASQWEEAWGEYMEALARMDEARLASARRYRGNARSHGKAKTEAKRARQRLEKMDPEFMARINP
jgi:hypothetical protein